MKKIIFAIIFIITVLDVHGQIVVDTRGIKPYDMGLAYDVLNAYSATIRRASEQVESYIGKALEAADKHYYRTELYWLNKALDLHIQYKNRLLDNESCASIWRRINELAKLIEEDEKSSSSNTSPKANYRGMPSTLSSSTSSASNTVKREENVSGNSNNKRIFRHVVEEGETIYSIAQMYAISIEELQSLNGLGTSTKLYVGQVLKCSR